MKALRNRFPEWEAVRFERSVGLFHLIAHRVTPTQWAWSVTHNGSEVASGTAPTNRDARLKCRRSMQGHRKVIGQKLFTRSAWRAS